MITVDILYYAVHEFFSSMVPGILLKSIPTGERTFPEGTTVLTSFINIIPEDSTEHRPLIVVVQVNDNLACAIASAMLSEKIIGINDAVIDAIGEMTNILTGAIKMKLSGNHKSSLPVTISGIDYNTRLAKTLLLCEKAAFEDKSGILEVALLEGVLDNGK